MPSPGYPKNSTLISHSNLPRVGQNMYKSILSDRLLGSLTVTTDLNPMVEGLYKLRRYSGSTPKWWPIPEHVSCSFPLYTYYRYVKAAGQLMSARDLLKLFGTICKNSRKLSIAYEYLDDFYRKNLKVISAYAFPKVFSDGPAFMLFTHLHALTGKAPYKPQQIKDDITEWTSKTNSSTGKIKNFDKESVRTVLDRIFSNWFRGESQGFLTFKEYCNDFIRWGTSGGAKKSKIGGDNYRTKWAWGYSHATTASGELKENYDLYEEAVNQAKNVCVVALKEEAQKTREIITTPMPSYLRQSYLLYRWGKPDVPSPISHGDWIAKFEHQSAKWYGCIDGDRFDHMVPAWFIREVISRLGGLDEHCREVSERELSDLESLKVEWNDHIWKWESGLLSGWRMTSLIGTLSSMCAAEFIMKRTGRLGSMEIGAMGDDLIMFSNVTSLDSETLADEYSEFGLLSNTFKTTSGPVGEFLRKVISKGGNWGYPALALRSLVYANPWISNYTYEKEDELSSSWMTFLSRMLPHSIDNNNLSSTWEHDVVQVLSSEFGPGEWVKWIHTPISVGGGGCVEMSRPSEWTTLTHPKISSALERKNVIPSLLGILKTKKVFSSVRKFHPVHIRSAYTYSKYLTGDIRPSPLPSFKKGVNTTLCCFKIMSGRFTISQLNSWLSTPLPRVFRATEPENILKFLLMGRKHYTGITTITHSKEITSMHSSLSKYISHSVLKSKRFNNLDILRPAMTMYFQQTYKHLEVPYGTW